ncbi:polymer-forming cytoskeletal protein [Myxococcota bacterium]|nr:polymer-forming cytoskeletal protein [Myxococcota bacterium]
MAERSTLIASGTVITGEVQSQDPLEIAGRIDGNVASSGSVTVLAGGVVRGIIRGIDVVIEGRVSGDVYSSGKLEIGARGRLHGDIRATRLLVQDGGAFRGQVDVTAPEGEPDAWDEAGQEGATDAPDQAELDPPAMGPIHAEVPAMWASGEFAPSPPAEDGEGGGDDDPAQEEDSIDMGPPDEAAGVEATSVDDAEVIRLERVLAPGRGAGAAERPVSEDAPPPVDEPELLTRRPERTTEQQIEAALARRNQGSRS